MQNPFAEIALILMAAAAIGALGTWLRQPLIVSFIAVGLLVGPAGFGVVTQHEEIELLASVGISLLLFVVGLKLDLDMIRTVGPVALATGTGQVVLTTVIGFGLALALGAGGVAAAYIGVTLTFSSTIIIVKLLSDRREIDALHGRIAVGILLVQDLVVILAMIALASLGTEPTPLGGDRSVLGTMLAGIGLLGAVLAMMRWVLPAFTAAIARSLELLVLFGIAWAVALAATAELLGFSKEVGAFLAGVSLASTPFRDTIGGRLVSVRDFLLLFFFIDLGARLDVSQLAAGAVPALVLSAFVLIGKPLVVMVLMGLLGYRKRTGFLAGMTMGQVSEFSLILGALGVGLGHIGADTMSLITATGLITIALSTYFINYSAAIYERMTRALDVFERRVPYRESSGDSPAPPRHADVILFGLGRYGSGIARHLRLRNRRVIGVDFDPEALARWRAEGLPVVYGDASDPELFEHLPLAGARWVVGTAPDVEVNRVLIRHLHALGYQGKIAVACRTEEDAEALGLRGADVLLRPFADAAEQAVDAITSGLDRVSAVAAAAPGLGEIRLGSGSVWAGWRLGDVPLRKEYGVSVLAISRSGRNLLNPGPAVQLFPGDRLILSGEPDHVSRAVDYLGRVDFGHESEMDFDVEEVPVTSVPEWQQHQTIAALDLRHRFGVTVVGVRRNGEVVAPDLHAPLAAGDRLIVAGSHEDLVRMKEIVEATS